MAVPMSKPRSTAAKASAAPAATGSLWAPLQRSGKMPQEGMKKE